MSVIFLCLLVLIVLEVHSFRSGILMSRVRNNLKHLCISVKEKENHHLGVIIIDHGSRRSESNDRLISLVSNYKSYSDRNIVEAAHMELGEPSIETAYRKCVEQGATQIICHPFFLSPGRHVLEDIPELVETASQLFPEVPYTITQPLGMHESILSVIDSTINNTEIKQSN